ncbi:MAG TPA: ACP S-malonyltransferase [Streptosporangiaceae bacterium]
MTLVTMFPGQGVQLIGMGGDRFERYPDLVEIASDILGYSIRRLCLEDPDGQLTDTRFTQPAVFVVNALEYRWLLDSGRVGAAAPDIALGHSLGEYNALEAAGVFDFADALRLVSKRAEITAAVRDGGMTAVLGLSPDLIRATLEAESLTELELANLNTHRQVVLSGPLTELDRAEPALLSAGAFDIRRLLVDGPFHSGHMRQIVSEFSAIFDGFRPRPPAFPVVSNVTARPHEQDQIVDLLVEHVCRPVRWADSIRWIVDTQPQPRFVSVGESGILQRMLRQICPELTGQVASGASRS